MARPQLSELAVELLCSECGRALNGESDQRGVLKVQPCQDCMYNAYEEGQAEAEQ